MGKVQQGENRWGGETRNTHVRGADPGNHPMTERRPVKTPEDAGFHMTKWRHNTKLFLGGDVGFVDIMEKEF